MKKLLFFPVFVIAVISSFAVELPNRRIFIEGTAVRQDILEFFYTNFDNEAFGTGYPVTDRKNEAAFILKFDVIHNVSRYVDGNQYVIKISLINNASNFEILAFDFYFNTLDEMYHYNQFLFLRAVSAIPPITEEDMANAVLNTSWRNKWLYLRASFDYPITFYALQPDGLIGGSAVYNGSYENPDRVSPEDHKVLAMPGWTIGFEFQFLNFMSLEFNFQFSMGDTRTNNFLNIAAGAELKFPIKYFTNFIIQPYGTFVFPIHISPVFSSFPFFMIGGGVQVGTRGGSRGAFFVDIKYLTSFADSVMRNPYGELFPNPSVIHYRRHVIGIGIGYKYGFVDRNPPPAGHHHDYYF